MSSCIITYPRAYDWQDQVRRFVQLARLNPEFDVEQVHSFMNNKDQQGLVSVLIEWVRYTHPLCVAPPFMEYDWTPVIQEVL